MCSQGPYVLKDIVFHQTVSNCPQAKVQIPQLFRQCSQGPPTSSFATLLFSLHQPSWALSRVSKILFSLTSWDCLCCLLCLQHSIVSLFNFLFDSFLRSLLCHFSRKSSVQVPCLPHTSCSIWHAPHESLPYFIITCCLFSVLIHYIRPTKASFLVPNTRLHA